jgi:8-oxo-dGTP pyrophosphatase MutT (NUDIX family)
MQRDPRLLAVLEASAPACPPENVTWARPMVITAYLSDAELPDEVVVSIRVIVRVGDGVVVCTNIGGSSHCTPGGQREPGETYAETACREVREETGWLVDPASLERLGFLHLFNLGEPNPPYPHPDVIQLVYVGRATERAAEEWTDTEGYELSSRVVPLTEPCELEPLCVPFLEVVRARA